MGPIIIHLPKPRTVGLAMATCMAIAAFTQLMIWFQPPRRSKVVKSYVVFICDLTSMQYDNRVDSCDQQKRCGDLTNVVRTPYLCSRLGHNQGHTTLAACSRAAAKITIEQHSDSQAICFEVSEDADDANDPFVDFSKRKL